MRKAGKLAAECLDMLTPHVVPGVLTEKLDELARDFILDHSALPAFLVRLLMGEMGEEFLLASRRIQPAKLLAAGYPFRFPELEAALRHEQQYLSVDTTQA